MLTLRELRRLLHYDPATGCWYRRTTCRNAFKEGDRADRLALGGKYRRVRIFKRSYLAHRLAHFYMLGAWPRAGLDHRNRDGTFNAWDNLRPATKSQNAANSKSSARNTSGQRGVCWLKDKKVWRAKITHKKKTEHLGTYDSFDVACAVYNAAADKRFGEFVCRT